MLYLTKCQPFEIIIAQIKVEVMNEMGASSCELQIPVMISKVNPYIFPENQFQTIQ